MTRTQTLRKANKIVTGKREEAYGKPEDNFAAIAALWSDYLGAEIGACDVANMMILLKVARMGGKGTSDCYVDICGYAAIGNEMFTASQGEIKEQKMRYRTEE